MSATEATDTKTLAVIGGGTMGSGIAQVYLQAGCTVFLFEADEPSLERAAESVTSGLRLGYRGAEDPDAAVAADFARLVLALNPTEHKEPSLVIEALPEELELKRRVLASFATAWPNTLIATNTSSLSITDLADAVTPPERFVGMHFFNPVPRSALVEIVTGRNSSEATVKAAAEWVSQVGLTSVVVNDSPGFATSRLGVLLGIEAIRMVEEKVASPEDIDQAMVLGYRLPIGPLRLTDLVGLDIRLAIAEYLEEKLGPRFRPPQTLRDMVAQGMLGKKSGRGFYVWQSSR